MNQHYFLLICQLGMGLFWIITYILIIKRGFQDKKYGMPMVALCANISWEFIFTFIYPQNDLQKNHYFSVVFTRHGYFATVFKIWS